MRKLFPVLFLCVVLIASVLYQRMVKKETDEIEATKLIVKQTKPVYEKGAQITEDDLSAAVAYSDGTRKEISSFTIKEKDAAHVTVLAEGLSETIDIKVIPIKSIDAFYEKVFYEGDAFDKKYVRVRATYADGTIVDAEPISAVMNLDTTAEIETEYGNTELKLPVVEASHITAEYTKTVHAGDSLQKKDFRVTLYFTDGEAKPITKFSVDGLDGPVETTRPVTVHTEHGDETFSIEPIPIVSAHPEITGALKAGEPLPLSGVAFIYQDGLAVTVPGDEVDFKTPIDRLLKAGDNTYKLSRYGSDFSFKVNAKLTTNVEDAKKYFKEEAETALYSHVSDDIFVTITETTTDVSHYFLAHIVINEPSQLQSELSYNSYGGTRELPTEAAKRLNWVIGVNGSNFDYATGKPTYAGAVIKNRQVMEGSSTNGMEICLMENGVLFSPEAGVDPYKLVLSDVTDSWSCGDTLLVNDGKAVNVGIQSEQYRYPRTAIGMVQPCEYYLLVSGTHDYQGGMTYDEVRDVLMSNGCSFGKCMDGGGSSSLVFEGKLINNPAVNNEERPVCDFLYFKE